MFKNNYTLRDTVCDDCNLKFGNELELYLGRDSYEGYVDRKLHMPKSKKKDFIKRRKTKICVGEGEYKGLYVELIDRFADKVNIRVLPQISLKRIDGSWNYFLVEEIVEIDKNEYALNEKHCLRAFGMDNETAKSAFSKIQLKFDIEGELDSFPENNLLFEISGVIDQVRLRAIAKIAFNYFAYFNNNQSLLLNECFDDVRNYILHGDPKISVHFDNESILENEKRSKYRRLGHIVTIDQFREINILSHVSLFNGLRYTVPLTQSLPRNEKLNVGFGHIFNFKNQQIIDIAKRGLIIIPTIWTP